MSTLPHSNSAGVEYLPSLRERDSSRRLPSHRGGLLFCSFSFPDAQTAAGASAGPVTQAAARWGWGSCFNDPHYIYHNPKPGGASTCNHLDLAFPPQIEISGHYEAHEAAGLGDDCLCFVNGLVHTHAARLCAAAGVVFPPLCGFLFISYVFFSPHSISERLWR